jgi:transcriptional regulator with XRE-family HTH domain
MSAPPLSTSELAAALRTARRARRISIAALAARAGVSARLISEFEQNKRPHVSLDTALRLLKLMEVPISVASTLQGTNSARARTERAERRRQTWTGVKTTLRDQDEPDTPASPAARLAAVANASRLAVSLQQARKES